MSLFLKPDIYTEGIDVNVAGISVKVFVNYPRRSVHMLLKATLTEREMDIWTEVSRGHSRCRRLTLKD